MISNKEMFEAINKNLWEMDDCWFYVGDLDCHCFHNSVYDQNAEGYTVEVYVDNEYEDAVQIFEFDNLNELMEA